MHHIVQVKQLPRPGFLQYCKVQKTLGTRFPRECVAHHWGSLTLFPSLNSKMCHNTCRLAISPDIFTVLLNLFSLTSGKERYKAIKWKVWILSPKQQYKRSSVCGCFLRVAASTWNSIAAVRLCKWHLFDWHSFSSIAVPKHLFSFTASIQSPLMCLPCH